MRKVLALLLTAFMLIPYVCYADDSFETSVSLCYNGDAYSVDYVFEVLQDVNITSVFVSNQNCIFDWNYVKSEARLYLSLASANVIPKAKVIATVLSDAQITLTPVSVTVNGNITQGVENHHTGIDMEYISPTCDKVGYVGGSKCANCGIVLIEPTEIPATGPVVKTALAENGALTVSGALSDNTEAEGTTFIAVYDGGKKMLAMKDVTMLNQSDFEAEFANCKDAKTVKIFRWDIVGLQPLHDNIELSINN